MRLIDADKLFCDMWRKADPYVEQELVRPCKVWNDACTMVRKSPIVDAEPVVHAHWEHLSLDQNEDYDFVETAECSNCGNCEFFPYGEPLNYCPNCGAKMGEKENTDGTR